MNLALRQLPDQPGFHCTKKKFTLFGTFPNSIHIVQNPFQLRTGEISINYQPRLLPKRFHQPFFFQCIAVFRCTAALPYNRMINRLTCVLIPYNRCFTLVGDTDCSNIRSGGTNFVHCLHGYTKLGGPDLICIMLYPARFWKILRKFFLCHAAHLTLFIKKNTTVTGGSCVECHYILCHKNTSSWL